MMLETPSETAELYAKMAAMRRANEALTSARRRDQELIVQLREQIARLEHQVEQADDEKIDLQTCIELWKQMVRN